MLCAWEFCIIQIFSSTYFYIKALYQNKELINLEENEMKRVCFYFPTEIIEMCDGNLSLAKAKSRNQFVIDAIKLYDCVLHKEVNTELLTPAFETVIDARLDLTEYRLSQIIFKLAFEMAATMNILAGTFQLDAEKFELTKDRVLNEVKAVNGAINLKDIIDYQNGDTE